ncbi:STAS domain-containing protein [Trichothermofontia sp.]
MLVQDQTYTLSVTDSNGIPLLQLPTRLSNSEAPVFTQVCQQLLQKGTSSKQIVMDCSQTSFLDRYGLDALVTNINIARQQGIVLTLRNVHPAMRVVLSITGLEQVLAIEAVVS